MFRKLFLFKAIILFYSPLIGLSKDNFTLVNNILKFDVSGESFITKEGWQELGLDQVIDNLDRTKTQVGAACLRNISRPHNDISKIIKQQEILTTLLTKHNYLSDLSELLDLFSQKEKSFFGLWDDSDVLLDKVKVFRYDFLRSFSNKNKYLMSLSSFFVLWQSFSGIFSKLSKDSFDEKFYKFRKVITSQDNEKIKELFKFLFGQMCTPLEAIWHWHRKDSYRYKNKSPLDCTVRWDNSWTMGDMHEWWQEFIQDCTSGDPDMADLKKYAWPSAIVNRLWLNINSLWQIKYFYKNLMSASGVLKSVNQRISDLAELLEIFKQIAKKTEILSQFHQLHQGEIEHFSVIDKLLTDFSNLQKKNILLYPGEILVLFNRINRIKDKLVPIFKHVGYLDAYCSISRIILEHENKGQYFAYAEFKEQDTPYINFKGVWLPVISSSELVTNDIELGANNVKNALFTGPNGSGKSTVMKSMAVSIVLAHSWGILPADSGVLSPFIGVRTYLDIKENYSKGRSTFMAEKDRIDEIVKFANSLSGKDFGFLIVDEPYRGTIEIESVNRVCRFGEHLAKLSNVSSVIATHLEKPIYLADETGAFANYNLDITQLSPKNFKRTFKLKSGPALWWFHDAQKRSDFVDWLCVTPV